MDNTTQQPERSAAQDDDMLDPQLRGPPATEAELGQPPAEKDQVSHLSDDEDDVDMDDVPATSGLKSPFTPEAQAQDSSLFVPEDSETPSAPPANPQAVMLAAQRKMVDLYRSRKQAEAPQATVAADETTKSAAHVTEKSKCGRKAGKDAAAKAYDKVKAAYGKKRRAGTAGMDEEIAFMRARHTEEARLRKVAADEEYDKPMSEKSDHDNAVDLSETEDLPQAATKLSAMYSDDSDSGEATPKKRGRKRAATAETGLKKKARKVGGTRYDEGDVEDVLERAKKATANRAGGGKKKAAPAATRGKGQAGRRKTGPTMTNLGSVMGTDVFGDTAATAHLGTQPTFGPTTRRPDALKQLIASVPTADKKAAGHDRRYLESAIRDFTGYATVKPSKEIKGTWDVKGMKSSLKHYQVMGTAFMRRRENDSHEPKGGILADQMGLGKTVMMLANIVNGRPNDKVKRRATLIVASPALVTQWQHEIEKHVWSRREHKQAGIGNVIQHRAGSRLTSNNNIEMLESSDIVLTTYHEVSRSYPKAIVPPNLVTAKQKDEWWRQHYEENRGILHRIRWFRIVLDEAQASYASM